MRIKGVVHIIYKIYKRFSSIRFNNTTNVIAIRSITIYTGVQSKEREAICVTYKWW